MDACQNFILPTDTFIAGTLKEYDFHVYDNNGNPIDISNTTCSWSLSNYTARNITPDIIKTGIIFQDIGDPFPYKFRITLESFETRLLDGKYVHQAKIIDLNGDIFIPAQGIIFINKNTNPVEIGRYWYNNALALIIENLQPIRIALNDRDRLIIRYADSVNGALIVPPYNDLIFESSNSTVAIVTVQGQIIGNSIGSSIIKISISRRPTISVSTSVTIF